MSEKAIENEIKACVSAMGGVVFKLHGNSFTGVGKCDLIGGVHGIPFAIEVKAEDNYKVGKLQKYWLKRLGEQGYKVGVVNSTNGFLGIILEEESDGIIWQPENDN